MLDGMATALGTLLIMGLILWLAYVFSKYIGRTGKIGGKTPYMKIIAQLPAGQYGTLAIVQTKKSYLLLGMTSSQITVLDEFEDLEELDESNAGKGEIPDFKLQLERLTKRKK
ncbi:flagellar biosynthetic protein FliO [Clostridium sp. C105KSO13]|uniref:flagellar biosynthetic protein FliO n=1 Tax=Clostridium sp. C105KSO13 TaxID=1776045 RepID=UPI0007405D37|nr:flagellar biosynthetic protein FliO [Clostridium sp. C105KSO13]CUX49364.1 Flagellar biosynthesis protein, FliO [Clostridium sp. C105KSO13]